MAVTLNDQGTDAVKAKTPHVAELEAFLQPDFDPVSYLDSVLPSLNTSTQPRFTTSSSSASAASGTSSALGDVVSQTQALLSNLTAQTSRLCNTLSQLTDEILRSGNRLAYEVDILRGETVGLTDALHNNLKQELSRFAGRSKAETRPDSTGDAKTATLPSSMGHLSTATNEPEHIRQLRMLALVRSRLDTVVKTFGQAMEWPVAPSDLNSSTASSSLISISAPTTNVAANTEEARVQEEKARAVEKSLREQIAQLLRNAKGVDQGASTAKARIDELRDLTAVWHGTREEKVRPAFLDGLEDMVDSEVLKNQPVNVNKLSGKKGGSSPLSKIVGRNSGIGSVEGSKDVSSTATAETNRMVSDGGYGFINNLRRLKGDIFLD